MKGSLSAFTPGLPEELPSLDIVRCCRLHSLFKATAVSVAIHLG